MKESWAGTGWRADSCELLGRSSSGRLCELLGRSGLWSGLWSRTLERTPASSWDGAGSGADSASGLCELLGRSGLWSRLCELLGRSGLWSGLCELLGWSGLWSGLCELLGRSGPGDASCSHRHQRWVQHTSNQSWPKRCIRRRGSHPGRELRLGRPGESRFWLGRHDESRFWLDRTVMRLRIGGHFVTSFGSGGSYGGMVLLLRNSHGERRATQL